MISDPVSHFIYPQEWVNKCRDPVELDQVKAGLSVLLSSGRVLRRGYTTGTTASAACKAAILSLAKDVEEVDVSTPSDLVVSVPVTASRGKASCRKYAGDYPQDATAGLEFVAQAFPLKGEVKLNAGKGIGRWSRTTSRVKEGEPSISRNALASIMLAMRQAVDTLGLEGVSVDLQVIGGEEAALRTLNPKVGVQGGISVLGSTGLVEPWDDHLEESNLERIAKADKVVLTTGRVGLRYSRLLFPEHEVVLVGSKIEKALQAAKGEVVLCGLPGLILKFIDPNVLNGTGSATVEDLRHSIRWNELKEAKLDQFKGQYPDIRVVLLDRDGSVVGDNG